MRKNEGDGNVSGPGHKCKLSVLHQKNGIVMCVYMFRDKIFKAFMQFFIMIPCFNGLWKI